MSFFNQSGMGAKKSPFIYKDQARLEIRSGGGCLSIFGLPFLLAGIFVMQIPLGIIPMEGSPGTLPAIFVVLFRLVFAAVGAGLIFRRSGIILDRGRGQSHEIFRINIHGNLHRALFRFLQKFPGKLMQCLGIFAFEQHLEAIAAFDFGQR